MLLDIYRTFRDDPRYNKLVGDDYLFAEYKCPLEQEVFQFKSESSFITFVISGRKDWLVGGQCFAVMEGDAVFIRKGIYTTRQYFEDDHCVLTFFITDDFIRTFLRENQLSTSAAVSAEDADPIFRIVVDDSLRTLLYSMYNYLRMAHIPRALVELKFRELLFNIALNPGHGKLMQYLHSLNETGRWQFEDVLMKNFNSDLDLEEFARMSGRSLSTFKRDFKNFYQQTPGKWLNEKRLDYAKMLLMTSDKNIDEVCYESGFKNSSHFNKAFKDRYKLPPRKFRESVRATHA
jgi:AraC-like DNA-binding protein